MLKETALLRLETPQNSRAFFSTAVTIGKGPLFLSSSLTLPVLSFDLLRSCIITMFQFVIDAALKYGVLNGIIFLFVYGRCFCN